MSHSPLTFQDMILTLKQFWSSYGCLLVEPMDVPMGAATFHPATFLHALGPEPWQAAFEQPCRRPTDGRYGENPNRLQHYYQFQVVMKPSPKPIQTMYLASLEQLGIDPLKHDIRFVEDNWESPTLGAWGLGWEVWLDGMEISQFTYFQQIGGIPCNPITSEITYGLERLAMFLQGVDNVYDLIWTHGPHGDVTYGHLFLDNEKQYSDYNFNHADVKHLLYQFKHHEKQVQELLEKELPLVANEHLLQASHSFNLLDARGAISVTERQRMLLRVRKCAQAVATHYAEHRRELGYPLLAEGDKPNES